jgi:hypothetical protein
MREPEALVGRARRVYQTGGLIPLIRQGLRFVSRHLFEYGVYYLARAHTEGIAALDEADFVPKVDDFSLRIVATNEEAEELERQGLEFRSCVRNARARLDSGAIAFCVFVGRELGHIGWVAMAQDAMDSLREPPMRIDFANHEAYRGGIWTNPEYRRLRLQLYGNLARRKFLAEQGTVRMYSLIAKRNVGAQLAVAKVNPNFYAEARYLRILWWKSWKEKPLTNANSISQGP